MDNKLTVNISPHTHKKQNTAGIMWLVVLSLVPAGAGGVLIFGLSALKVVMLGIAAAVITEALIQRLTKRKISILDGSAFMTGLLLAYNLPPHVPFWIPVIGSAFAIAIGKQAFGGLGHNIFNPALVGRAFLMASWPKLMTTYVQPMNYDAVTQATPLMLLKEGKLTGHISYLQLFLGERGGCIGEVCIAALLVGALFLLIRGYISWHIPVSYIGTAALLAYAFAGKTFLSGDWLFQIMSGGLILGAFFMATDYVTSPLTYKGQVIFGIGCGIITMVIRLWGGYPEGVCYSILIMNAAVPIIDRYTRPRIYGTKLAKNKL